VWSPERGSKGISYKYQTRVEMTDSDKHAGILFYKINYGRKKFYNKILKVDLLTLFTYYYKKYCGRRM
jgi:hypothetical protein